jgi:iron-sulfur cluster repair protein YtfE (RIC family)
MNAIELLRKDHEKVKQMFAEYDLADDRKREIAESVFRELEAHSRVEEDIFYPAVRKHSNKQGKEMVKHSLEEHREVDDLISELRAMDPSDPDFDDRFEEMIEDVEHHIEQEEAEMFPMAEDLGKELDRLGEQIEEEKELVLRR